LKIFIFDQTKIRILEIYKKLRDQHQLALQKAKNKYNLISLIRLLLTIGFILSGYFYLDAPNQFLGWTLLLLALVFILLIRVHDRLRKDKAMEAELLAVNERELTYLKKEGLPFDNGEEYVNAQHPYSHDIDIFGEQSIFQHVNRTATFLGKDYLAHMFERAEEKEELAQRQQAIAELSDKIEFRQRITAIANIKRDSKELHGNIIRWSQMKEEQIPVYLPYVAYFLAAVFLALAVGRLIYGPGVFGSLMVYSFIINLGFLYSQLKKIQRQIVGADKVRDVIHQYSLIIQAIEEEKFESPKLKALQEDLKVEGILVSQELAKLARLFSSLDAIQNVVGAIVFNGTFLYHIHILARLLNWKQQRAKALQFWLERIGELEALNSLANFAYNHPDYCFPELNDQYEIAFQDLGHPLLDSHKRVNNDISFKEHPFIILTGSNMSGKSTFLRALGVNMVLAGMGSVVCARSANIHPLPLLVSMRLTDSLADSESYFFAEVKRLNEIMQALENQRAFVLLDEILRGTNSDDKRNGTIQVIKKMVARKVVGAIATHDLEVCKTTDQYPNYLINKAFEVEIIKDELHFDYKLRNGICQNQSATFLMKKMGVI
jgi:ABC-type multidrug transport system fused ATPase/permease subunit